MVGTAPVKLNEQMIPNVSVRISEKKPLLENGVSAGYIEKFDLCELRGVCMKFKLVESGLSRLHDAMEKYDVICISADKYLPDRRDYSSQEEYDYEFRDRLGKYKKLDHKALLIALKGNGYGVTKIKGFYQYNQSSVPSKENSYCVVNRSDDPNFLNTLLKLAVDCKQNSIYFVPKGTFEGSWIYTGVDLSEEDGIDKVHSFGDKEYKGPVHFGNYAVTDNEETGYSLLNGRPFSSYDKGEIQTQVKRVKTKNISNNITVIDESYSKVEDLQVTPYLSQYLKKFDSIRTK